MLGFDPIASAPLASLETQNVTPIHLSGSATFVFIPTAAINVRNLLGGVSPIQVMPNANLIVAKHFLGSAQVTVASIGAISVGKQISGFATVHITPTATLQVWRTLSGLAGFAFTPIGDLSVPATLSGHAHISLISTGTIRVSKRLSGLVMFSIVPQAALTVIPSHGDVLVSHRLPCRVTLLSHTLQRVDVTHAAMLSISLRSRFPKTSTVAHRLPVTITLHNEVD